MTSFRWDPDYALLAVLILFGIMLHPFPDRAGRLTIFCIRWISENADCSLPIHRSGSDKFSSSYSGT